jgi:hypothetical protein
MLRDAYRCWCRKVAGDGNERCEGRVDAWMEKRL